MFVKGEIRFLEVCHIIDKLQTIFGSLCYIQLRYFVPYSLYAVCYIVDVLYVELLFVYYI